MIRIFALLSLLFLPGFLKSNEVPPTVIDQNTEISLNENLEYLTYFDEDDDYRSVSERTGHWLENEKSV